MPNTTVPAAATGLPKTQMSRRTIFQAAAVAAVLGTSGATVAKASSKEFSSKEFIARAHDAGFACINCDTTGSFFMMPYGGVGMRRASAIAQRDLLISLLECEGSFDAVHDEIFDRDVRQRIADYREEGATFSVRHGAVCGRYKGLHGYRQLFPYEIKGGGRYSRRAAEILGLQIVEAGNA